MNGLIPDGNGNSLADLGGNGNAQSSNSSYQTRARSTTASTLIFSDLCEKHGDRLIAYDVKTGEIICNRCVYSRDQSHYQFTSTIAKKVSVSQKQKFAELEKSLQGLQDVAPQKISDDLQSCVSKFLEEVMTEIEQYEGVQDSADSGALSNNTFQAFANSLKADIQRSEEVKKKIDHHLATSLFTRLAKEQMILKKEIKATEAAREKVDKSMYEGLQFRNARQQKFNKNQEALKKVIEDITSEDIIRFISANDPPAPKAAQPKPAQTASKTQ